MNLNQLRAFHAVAVERSFTKAAKRLGVTQPSCTSHVKALEQAYEVELLLRQRSGIELTETGRQLFAMAEEIFAISARADEVLSSAAAEPAGLLRIGSDNPFHAVSFLPAFQKSFPKIEIQMSFGNGEQISAALREFRVDVGLMTHIDPVLKGPAHFLFRRRGSQSVVLVVPAKHRWATKRHIRLKDLQGLSMIRRESGSITQAAFDRFCHKKEIEPCFVMELGSREALREAVVKGVGIGVISAGEIGNDPRIKGVPFQGGSPQVHEFIICLAARKNAPLIRSFRESVFK